MKRFCALLLCAVLLCMALPWQTRAAEMDVNAKSALLMDAATGTVLLIGVVVGVCQLLMNSELLVLL